MFRKATCLSRIEKKSPTDLRLDDPIVVTTCLYDTSIYMHGGTYRCAHETLLQIRGKGDKLTRYSAMYAYIRIDVQWKKLACVYTPRRGIRFSNTAELKRL
jgi:hypothetical protein